MLTAVEVRNYCLVIMIVTVNFGKVPSELGGYWAAVGTLVTQGRGK